MTFILQIILVFLAIIGFCLALYIYYKKREQKVLICPLGSDCNAVIQSKYSKFLGIPVEIIGIIYYIFVILFSITITGLISQFVFLILVSLAFLFSLYLTVVQLFIIKQWCFWCLVSFVLSIIIFVITINI